MPQSVNCVFLAALHLHWVPPTVMIVLLEATGRPLEELPRPAALSALKGVSVLLHQYSPCRVLLVPTIQMLAEIRLKTVKYVTLEGTPWLLPEQPTALSVKPTPTAPTQQPSNYAPYTQYQSKEVRQFYTVGVKRALCAPTLRL